MNLKHVDYIVNDDPANAITANVYVPADASLSKKPIVLLPFWGGNADTYSSVQQHLMQQHPQHASVAISYRGTGRANTDLDTDHRNFAISSISASLATFLRSEVLRKLVDTSQLIVCAHSWSAKVALSLMIRDAAPGDISICSLLLICPAPPKPIVLDAIDRGYRRAAYDTLESSRFTIENVLTHRTLSSEQVDALAQGMVSMSQAAKRGWIEVGIWEDWTLDLKLFVAAHPDRLAPILVLVAEQDKVEVASAVEEDSVEFLRALGFTVKLDKTTNCGHLIPLEDPEAVVKAIASLL